MAPAGCILCDTMSKLCYDIIDYVRISGYPVYAGTGRLRLNTESCQFKFELKKLL